MKSDTEAQMVIASMMGIMSGGIVMPPEPERKEVRNYRERPLTSNQSNEVKRRLRQERKRQLKMENNNVK